MTNYHTIFGRSLLAEWCFIHTGCSHCSFQPNNVGHGLPYDTAFNGQKMALRSGQSGHFHVVNSARNCREGMSVEILGG